jgi:hypothetical protein
VLVDLLKDRYVRGELDLEAYEERLTILLDESATRSARAVHGTAYMARRVVRLEKADARHEPAARDAGPSLVRREL